MTLVHTLLLALAGVGTGLLGAVLGIGGGVFLIPVLVLGFGVPMHHAVATSLLAVIATSSAVASTNVEGGVANMRLGMTLELATVLGAMAGGLAAGALTAGMLEGLFAGILLPTAVLMWRGRAAEAAPEGDEEEPTDLEADAPEAALEGRYYDRAERRVVTYRVRRLGGGLGVSFAAGGVSGLLGIGGGIFKVPALHLLCDVPIKAAAATSNFMIGVTAAASAFLYYGRGDVRPGLAAATVLGVLAGSALGTVVNRRARGVHVRRVFAVLLVVVAVQMLLRALHGG